MNPPTGDLPRTRAADAACRRRQGGRLRFARPALPTATGGDRAGRTPGGATDEDETHWQGPTEERGDP